MTVVPAGYSRVSVGIEGPSPAGGHLCVVTYALHAAPSIELADRQVVSWQDFLTGRLYNEYTPLGIRVQDETTGFDSAFEDFVGEAGATVPPQVCCLVRKLSGTLGKKNRGRMYIPGLLADGDVTDSGTITSGPYASFVAGISDLFTNITTDPVAPADMVILHTDGSTPTPVIGLSFENVVATQRRRFKRG